MIPKQRRYLASINGIQPNILYKAGKLVRDIKREKNTPTIM